MKIQKKCRRLTLTNKIMIAKEKLIQRVDENLMKLYQLIFGSFLDQSMLTKWKLLKQHYR